MAYPVARSCNRALNEGMTDGVYKKVVQDRGGKVDPLTYATRREFSDVWYGIHEIDPKMMPDGLMRNTPNFEQSRPVAWH